MNHILSARVVCVYITGEEVDIVSRRYKHHCKPISACQMCQNCHFQLCKSAPVYCNNLITLHVASMNV